jgi:hypothetical protein
LVETHETQTPSNQQCSIGHASGFLLVLREQKRILMAVLNSRVGYSVVLAIGFVVGGSCSGQDSVTTESAAVAPVAQGPAAQSPAAQSVPLPDAPVPQGSDSTSQIPADEQQTKRVLGVMPNFRSVSPGEAVPKATVKDKFLTSTLDNFDYSSLFFAGLIAADSMATKQTPEFHQGAAGFGRYYWHTVADQSIENYFVEFIIPSINHEDSRYYAMGKRGGGFWKRAGYSLSRAVVTKSDEGKPMFNYGEVFGSAAAASISMAYYPSTERTVGNGLRNWGLDVTYDSVTFLFHEFWPDIASSLMKKKQSTTP